MTDFPHTAILIFARSAPKESAVKRLQHRNHRNQSFHEGLLEQTFSKASHSGLPIICISEDVQRGGDFGERLTNAFQDVFSKGFQQVIAIGSDCPNLAIEDFKAAEQALAAGKAAIGPDHRGGVYLLGLSKSMFFASSFGKLLWQTSQLSRDLELYFNQLEVSSVELAVKSDLNGANDVVKLCQTSRTLKLLLKQLQTKTIRGLEPISYLRLAPAQQDHRGPPVF